ncbi:MAG: hypothetical protein PQ612_06435 [Rickettsiales bacterium]|nr:hypothetical protein [Pseudomonadota bacterium]MDA0966610.1 hypothetical protein [Pseudomonadota bacterium]MDG4543638.1 hypothetical protein [Rickettsiales bacterium]MDG4545785.1 hypothetical protein [Rickettsiales bacterium]MDG4547441.1 hypothetical protein [Rickettsiales bacterium]
MAVQALLAALPAITGGLKGIGDSGILSALTGGGTEQNVSQTSSNSSVTNTSVGISNSFGGDSSGSPSADFATELSNQLSSAATSLPPTPVGSTLSGSSVPQIIGIPNTVSNQANSFLSPTNIAIGGGIIAAFTLVLALTKKKKRK